MMKLKLDGNGHVVTAGGHPVYVFADGTEKPFDAAASVARAERAEVGIVAERIGFAISHSKFVAEKLVLPPDMAADSFRSSFKMEGGQPVGYGAEGVKIYSRQRPGEVAGLDEALERIVAQHSEKAKILKSPASTTGAGPKSTPGAPAIGKGRALTRTVFEQLPADAKMAHVKAGGILV
jgi:hypothetical protein